MKSLRSLLATLALTASVFTTATCIADVTLPAIFSKHAVLQKSAKVPIWGLAAPGESISVSLDDAGAKVVAGPDGKWQTTLDLSAKGPGPYTLEVHGNNELSIEDVLVGEVWLCSGQSNMQWVLKNTIDAETEIASSQNPMLRQFLVKRGTSLEPLETFAGEWTIAGPEKSGAFTAVGYYFGKKLNQELNVPVGLIHSSWGGTPSEAWTSAQAIDSNPDLKAAKERLFRQVTDFPAGKVAFLEKYPAWSKENGREDRPVADVSAYTGPAAGEGWIKVKLPGPITAADLPSNGALWIRHEVEVPAAAQGKPLQFECEPIIGIESVYWNGKKIGEATLDAYAGSSKRRYTIPAEETTAGKAVLALRIFAPIQPPNIYGNPQSMRLGGKSLQGEWQVKGEFELPALDPQALAAAPVPPKAPPALQNTATCLFNAMINPLLPYAIQGAIWYQGESNAGRAFQYRTAFPLMIDDWRKHWKQGDFPFYFVQLANFMDKTDTPGESGWAELREAQSMALSLPNTGMATTIDIGETKDIHPRNKKDVGERLAAIALARDYGKKAPYQGPTYVSMTSEEGKVRLKFNHTDGGLVARPLPEIQILDSSKGETAPLTKPKPESELQGFAICGEDKVWKWANAKIEGNDVIVWADEVVKPIAVRYAWANNPTCNLYNGAGFPAIPFRTDDFPGTTVANKY